MKMVRSLILALSIALISGAHRSRPHVNYNFEALDHFIDSHADLYRNQVVVLISQRGKLIYKKELGLEATDVRLVASASKWLSGAVILSLIDERKLALDDSVGKFLPIFSTYGKGAITIRQLFSHTSGFARDDNDRYGYRKDLTLAQAVDSIARFTALRDLPGSVFRYGGTSMQVAGRIAEVAAGKSWQQLVDEKLAAPCGIRISYGNTRNPIIAGGVRISARDYLKFLEMIADGGLVEGKRVLSLSAIKQMLQDQTHAAAVKGSPYPVNPFTPYPAQQVRYGFGNWLDVIEPRGNVQECSSPGLFGTHPWLDTKHHVAGIIFTVTRPRVSTKTSLEMRKLIRETLERK